MSIYHLLDETTDKKSKPRGNERILNDAAYYKQYPNEKSNSKPKLDPKLQNAKKPSTKPPVKDNGIKVVNNLRKNNDRN